MVWPLVVGGGIWSPRGVIGHVARLLNPQVDFRFHEVMVDGSRVALLEVGRATSRPVAFVPPTQFAILACPDPGASTYGYYRRRVYHPIVASAGETGNILDLQLREGRVHTADGGLEFVLEVLEPRAARRPRLGTLARFTVSG